MKNKLQFLNVLLMLFLAISFQKSFAQASAPTNLVATAGINSASVAFTAPTAVVGGAITNYNYSLDNGSSWVGMSPAQITSPLDIKGLTNCTDYPIKIRAVNVVGGGTASAAVTVTPQNGQQAGVMWTYRASQLNNNWYSVTYGNGLFVAVGTGGSSPNSFVMTSPDGNTWTSRPLTNNKRWSSVTYGNGLFVATAQTGTLDKSNLIMTSPDGINWTIGTPPVYSAGFGWNSVTYGNGLFVAVGYNSLITSTDGITWTLRTSPKKNNWAQCTYGNGLFVAVSNDGIGNRVITSPDGISWTSRTSAADMYWTSIIYGNGLFVALSSYGTGNPVITSPDGINWTSSASADNSKRWDSLTFGNGLFVAMSSDITDLNQMMTSPDGITWNIKTTPTTYQWRTVAYGNGRFLALATGGESLISSSSLAPSTPAITAITPSRVTASVAFTASVNSGTSDIANYEYSIDNGGTWIARSPALTTSPLTVSGLIIGNTYLIKLRAVNATNTSCESVSMSTTTSNATALPTANAQTFCGNPTVANLVGTGTDLLWYTAETNGTALASSALITSGTYYVSQTIVSYESARIPVSITVNTPTAPTSSNQTFCENPTVANLVATGSNLKWYAVATNGTVLATSTALATGTYYVSQTLNSCESTRTTVAVTLNHSVGGTISGSTTLLLGTNTATLSLTGYTGSIIKWQSSSVSDFSTNVADIDNTTSSLTLNDLIETTYYRAVVQNSNCTAANSAIGTVAVTSSGGGTTTGGATLCSATNSTTLTLSTYVGTIAKWQSCTVSDFTSGVVDIANTSANLTITNLTTTKYYRAVVANGTPTPYISSVSTITCANVLNLQNIYGPTDLCGLTTATFGVPAVAGATKYIWTLPAGLSALSSAGNEVVVNIDPSYVSGTISLRASNVCPGINSVTKSILTSRKPVVTSITGPTSSGTLTTATYTAPALPNTSYTWTLPTGMSPLDTTINSISVDIDPGFTGGLLSCIATNACGVGPKKSITISSEIATPIVNLSGPSSLCGLTTATYTVTSALTTSLYNWTVPSGVSITSGQNTKTLIVTIFPAFTGGEISVGVNYSDYIAPDGSSVNGTITKKITLVVVQAPSAITGPKALCGLTDIPYDTTGNITTSDGIAYYSIGAVTGAINYIWTVPTGASIISGDGTTRIGVSFDYSLFNSGTISVQSQSACGTSAKSNIVVNRLGGSIIGFPELCGVRTARYYLPFTTGSGFNWTVPSWMTIISGQGTSDISVEITGAICSDTVKIDFVSNCGTAESFVLTVGCSQSSRISPSICGTTLASEYTSLYANTLAGATMYKFNVSNGSQTQEIEQATPVMNLTNFTGWNYGVTYTISVAPKVNGYYLDYGCSCNVTAPAGHTTQLATCGVILTSMWNTLYCNSVSLATGYQFKVSTFAGAVETVVGTYNSSSTSFNLMQIPGIKYGTVYGVSVAPFYNGAYQAYGSSCSVTTPAVANLSTQMASSLCGTTLSSVWNSLYCDAVTLATGYQFEVKNGATLVGTYNATSNVFNLMQLPGILYGTTYSIRVAPYYDGSYRSFGSACTVTTPTPTTQLVSSVCGATLTSLYAPLYANAVTLATGYSFQVSTGGNVIGTYDTTSNVFNLMQLSGITYATTYSVRVAPIYNGQVQSFGTACTVITPAIGTTKLVSTVCGATLTSLYAPLYANAFTLVTGYSFQVSTGGNVIGTFEASSNVFNLMQLSGILYGTTYSIKVAPVYNGQVQSFGTACTVITPAIPTTQVVASRCNTTLTSLYAPIYANAVSLATGYQFEVSTGGSVLGFYNSSSNVFNLKQVAGTAKNTAYSIRVAVLYNDVYQSFGSPCTVTTASNANTRMTDGDLDATVFTAKAFPNPFATSFNLSIESSSDDQVEVKVYDMIGRELEARKATVSELSTQELGSNFPSGVYNIIVSQGDYVKTLRMIKR